MLVYNFNTSFFSPHALLSEESSGEKAGGTLELPSFAELEQVRCPRRTRGDRFPGEIWQFYHHRNDKTHFMLFETPLMCVIAFYLHLGVGRRGGLVFTSPKSKQHERSLPASTPRTLMSLLLASGTFCGSTLLAQVRHESAKSACPEVNMPVARPLNLRVEKEVNQWGGGKPSAP